MPESYCAVTPDSSSPDSTWFIKIINTLETNLEITDDYENKIAPRQSYIEGEIMEQVGVLAMGFLLKHSKDKTFFKESLVYPFVQLKSANICQ